MSGGRAYLHRPLALDLDLGHAAGDGKVYENRFGPDRYIGRVELDTGRIYEARLGPDRYVAHVDLKDGKVYRQLAGRPDEYLGRVDQDGRCYQHRPQARDPYVGCLKPMAGFPLAGAAFFLLMLPRLEEDEQPPAEAPGSPAAG